MLLLLWSWHRCVGSQSQAAHSLPPQPFLALALLRDHQLEYRQLAQLAMQLYIEAFGQKCLYKIPARRKLVRTRGPVVVGESSLRSFGSDVKFIGTNPRWSAEDLVIWNPVRPC